jgi:hypothetical protein
MILSLLQRQNRPGSVSLPSDLKIL